MYKAFVSKHRWIIYTVIITIFAAIGLMKVSLDRHWSLGTYYYDLGIMHQTVYNTSQGRFFQLTDPESAQQIIRFAIHFDPLMAIFAPFYWMWNDAAVLLIGQSLFLALGAIPVFLLARKIFEKVQGNIPTDAYGAIFATIYLLYVPMQRTNVADFHAVTLATSLLLAALYCIEIKAFRWSWLFIGLALLGKENVGFTTAALGLYVLLFRKERAYGLQLILVSILTVATVILWIIPSQRGGDHFASSYYTLDIVTNLQYLFSWRTAGYVNELLLPIGYVSLLSPLHLLIPFPEWLINVLSKNGNMRSSLYHYTALLTPFVMLSAMRGIHFIAAHRYEKWKFTPKFLKSAQNHNRITILAVMLVLTLSIVSSIVYDPVFNSRDFPHTDTLRIIKIWQDKLKDSSVPVSTTGHLASYFSGRKYFYNFLFDFTYEGAEIPKDVKQSVTRYEHAQYVLIQKSEVTIPSENVKFYYNHLLNNKKYQKVFDEEGIEVYERVSK